jgi:alkylhydroperoxidase family enzyme
MRPFFLPGVENHPDPSSDFIPIIEQARAAGMEASPVWFLASFKPAASRHLMRFTQEVMRGPSPLSPGMRELIAAFTSARNRCVY